MVRREKRPKGLYGSVKLKISNWRKISAFKANKLFANKTLRAGRKIRVLQIKPLAWKLFFRDVCVTLCKKDTVSLFKKGITYIYTYYKITKVCLVIIYCFSFETWRLVEVTGLTAKGFKCTELDPQRILGYLGRIVRKLLNSGPMSIMYNLGRNIQQRKP